MRYENEVTVEVKCSMKKLDKILKEKGFSVKLKYEIKDIYMIERSFPISDNYLEMLEHCLLIRNTVNGDVEKNTITFKHKIYNENEEIIKQSKVDCIVGTIKEAKQLLEALKYKELIRIDDHLTIYGNDSIELAVQEVNDKHLYIEIEQKCRFIDKKFTNVEEIIDEFKKYDIPIKSNDFFVKKAEIELIERYNSEKKNI